ncbi:isochorismate synthase [Sinomicrobium sp.]
MRVSENDFFYKLRLQYEKQLPFVAYRKPPLSKQREGELYAVLQKDDNLHIVEDYSEHGFVFSPFNQSGDTVLIPVSDSATSSEVLHSSYTAIREGVEDNKSLEKLEGNSTAKEQHIKLVEEGIAAIKIGKLEKVVLSRKKQIPVNQKDAISVFKRLLNMYRDAFCYIWYHPKVGLWFGATPEVLLHIRDNHLYTMALAGTQKFVEGQEAVWGSKEIWEQQLVTDAIVESLKYKVNRLKISPASTQKAGNLLHIKTDIEAELGSDFKSEQLESLLHGIHPTPAICGFPREKALQFICEHEGYRRTYYSGFLGELNMSSLVSEGLKIDENSALYVNLRCMQFTKDEAVLYVGGGITAESDAEAEWQETVNKLETMRKVLL